ncbi:MAG: alpha/beta fold hydrolase, partial [Candidatus Micrarchaeota archaeon]|nr:alpha/beta fold hydrolase [Candidatus Micrarchaeota archaeon]
GSFVSSIVGALANALPQGFGLFSFNNRGHDQVSSMSKFIGAKRVRFRAGTSFEKFEDSVYDIGGAIDAMQKLGFRKFILCGHSTGCQKAIYYQYKMHDRRVSGIALLGPADDYNLLKKQLGRRYAVVKGKCKRLISKGKGEVIPDLEIGLCAQRLDSQINLGRVEARLLDYSGPMKEFGAIKVPILAVFGSEEEYRLMHVDKHLDILSRKSRSMHFSKLVIPDANHSFTSNETVLAKNIYAWAAALKSS